VFFVVNVLSKGEIEKSSGQYLGLIVMSHLTCLGLNSNLGHFCGSTTIYLVWRIVFTCLVVCR
jgi:hypothetical protein